MRRITLKVMTLSVALLTFLATTTVASACWFGAYQPEEPKSLREE
ncbi:MAG: hypothetical protein K0Q97_1126 [Bacillota bacterium]|jgi:cyclic lactone autoinducer peptide|nr:hypothetical protein [Bacillota bacterium]